jgi:hypothetical protein
MTIKTLIGAASLAIASLSAAQQAVPEGTVPGRASKSRAEVLTEFSLWRRAGLDRYNVEGADQSTVDYQRRMEQYAWMRNGPQYVAELQRIQAGQAQHAAARAHQGS